MSPERVSVVGLGKLGLCLASVLANSGYVVKGVDVDRSKVDAINKGRCPIYEPGLQSVMKANRARLSATRDYDVVGTTDTTFVVVPTPSSKSGGFSLDFVAQAMKKIGIELSRKDGYHLIVLTSTVMPGSMDRLVKPVLERTSGKVCGKDFGLCYSPEFIALGDVIRGLTEPDLILIGESDKAAGRLLAKIQENVCVSSPAIQRMNFVNAEITKIAINSYVTMKISFANTIAEISEQVPEGNVDTISSAIGRDRRIGSAFLKGALGFGGPCFPRDNIAFSRFAQSLGISVDLALATHRINNRQVGRIVRILQGQGAKPGMKVGVLGLSYKPNTDVVEASQSMMIAEALRDKGYEVHVTDPAALEIARPQLGSSVIYHKDAKACVSSSEFVILATPWPVYRKLNASVFANKSVIDCWRLRADLRERCSSYTPLGIGMPNAVGA